RKGSPGGSSGPCSTTAKTGPTTTSLSWSYGRRCRGAGRPLGEGFRVGSALPPSATVTDGADGLRRGRLRVVQLLPRAGNARPLEPGLQGGARSVPAAAPRW